MNITNLNDFRNLSIPEKIILLENLWDTISIQEDEVPIPDSHILELKEREERYTSEPGNLLTLEQLKENIEK